MKKKFPVWVTVCAVVLALGIALGIAIPVTSAKAFEKGFSMGAQKVLDEANRIDVIVLKNELIQISELATYEYVYTEEVEADESLTLFDRLDLPFTKNHYRLAYSGVIKAGIDFQGISLASERDGEVTLVLPKAEILDHYIDDASVKVIDQDNNIFNPIELQDVFDALNVSDDEQLKLASKDGLLEKAEDNAKALIENFIHSVYGSDMIVNFK